jgi:hypothetical protein
MLFAEIKDAAEKLLLNFGRVKKSLKPYYSLTGFPSIAPEPLSFTTGILSKAGDGTRPSGSGVPWTASIRSANLTPGMPSGYGQNHRGAAVASRELHQKIDRSYKTEVGRCLRPCKVFSSINAFLEGRLDTSGPLRFELLDQPLGFASFREDRIEGVEKHGLVKTPRITPVALGKTHAGNT